MLDDRLTVKDVDRIMRQIGYTRGMCVTDPKNGKILECWYSNNDIEKFSVMVKVRLSDAGFKFEYGHNNLKTMTRLSTDWFSPLTKKKHFMKWFKQFVEDAFWFSKKYTDIVDERIVEDMVMLCDGAMKQISNTEWQEMSQSDKRCWCEDFGLEHAHVIKEECNGL